MHSHWEVVVTVIIVANTATDILYTIVQVQDGTQKCIGLVRLLQMRELRLPEIQRNMFTCVSVTHTFPVNATLLILFIPPTQ